MSKPEISKLEIIAIRNQLDVAVWSHISQGRQNPELEPRIKELSRKYFELTNEHYVYGDTRGQYTD